MSVDLSLYFYPVEIKEVLDEIANLNVSIAELVESISMMRENCEIFGRKIILDFNSSIRFYWIFTPEIKKSPVSLLVSRIQICIRNETFVQLVFYPVYLKLIKGLCFIR